MYTTVEAMATKQGKIQMGQRLLATVVMLPATRIAGHHIGRHYLVSYKLPRMFVVAFMQNKSSGEPERDTEPAKLGPRKHLQ